MLRRLPETPRASAARAGHSADRSKEYGRASTSPATNLDIVVATQRDADGEVLIRELQRTRARVRHIWPVLEPLPEDSDIVFCDLAPGLPACVPWLPGDPKAALVVVVPPVASPDLDLLHKCAPDAVLHRPISASAVRTSLVLARTRFAYEQRLRWRISKLSETLQAFRSVERAKAILMNDRNMQEDEAYHFMRRQAMERRVSISTVAATIIDSHEILR